MTADEQAETHQDPAKRVIIFDTTCGTASSPRASGFTIDDKLQIAPSSRG